MKPLHITLAAVALTASVQAIAMQPAGIRLALYEKPVTFFQEGKQGVEIGALPAGINSMSAAACIECHRSEHAEWKNSAHARSVTEPVFEAAFKAEPRFLCRSCHSPLLEQHPKVISAHAGAKAEVTEATVQLEQKASARSLAANQVIAGVPNPRFQQALMTEGVTCVTCHVRDGVVLSSRSVVGKRAPHALSYSPMLGTAQFCAGCHDFEVRNPQAHPFESQPFGRLAELSGPTSGPVAASGAQPTAPQIQQTAKALDPNGDEPPIPSQPSFASQYHQDPRFQHSLQEMLVSAGAAKGDSCQSCHMERVKGRATHNWPGRNSEEMLKKAITLEARLDRTSYKAGDKLQAVLKIKNSAGHSFPTGDSLHAGILDVWLRDGDKTLGRQVLVMAEQSQPMVQRELRSAVRELQPVAQPGGFGGGGLGGGGFSGSLGVMNNSLVPDNRGDTRLKAGEEKMLVFSDDITGALASAKEPVLRIRVFHSPVHPAFRGSGIDPSLSPMKLIREAKLPIKIIAPDTKTAQAVAPRNAP